MYKSTDSGLTWNASSSGLFPAGCPAAEPCPAIVGRIAIAVAPSNPQRLYAVIENKDIPAAFPDRGLLGIFTSANGGTSWSAVTGGAELDFFCHTQCTTTLSSRSTRRTRGSSTPVASSSTSTPNFGSSYGGGPIGFGTTFLPNSIHVDFHALRFDASGRLWAGSDGGVYRRELNGNLTNLNAGLGITQFYPGISGKANERLIGGAQDNGSSRYDGGPNWTGILGADGGYTAMHPTNRNILYATAQQLQIYKSTDAGVHMLYAGPFCGRPGTRPPPAG